MVLKEESKEDREKAINEKIELMRKRNQEIIRRHQEIENDKKNADSFSQEALLRCKQQSADSEDSYYKEMGKRRTTAHDDDVRPRREIRESRRLPRQLTLSNDAAQVLKYRPQILTEKDMPPADPAFSYLTDRLREGALCAPVSPLNQRKYSTSSMSTASSGTNSRKISTASNSSWTSDSSKSSGFSNYQPPRKYSVCRDYFKSRRISDENSLSNYRLEKRSTINSAWDGACEYSNKGEPYNNGRVDSCFSTDETWLTSKIPRNEKKVSVKNKDSNRKRAEMQKNWRNSSAEARDQTASDDSLRTCFNYDSDVLSSRMKAITITDQMFDANNNEDMTYQNVTC